MYMLGKTEVIQGFVNLHENIYIVIYKTKVILLKKLIYLLMSHSQNVQNEG